MVGMCDLPPELLIEILRWLDTSSNKEARLTCRQWAAAGPRCLSHRVYYAPRPDRINIFTSITENTTFAATFTELVYDARLFCRSVLDNLYYPKCYHQPGFPRFVGHGDKDIYHDPVNDELSLSSPPVDEKIKHCREQYALCLRHQTKILETGQDLDILCTAMKRLPNLRQISILDSFEDVADISPFISTRHQWYRRWSATQFTGMVEPAKLSDMRARHPWDFRGIQNLFKAVSLYAPKVQNLILGCELGNLSTMSYGRPNIREMMEDIVPRLSKLKVDCDPSTFEILDGQWRRDIASLVHKGQQLNEMSLNVGRSMTLNGKWPQLRVLELDSGHVDLPTLKAFSQFHANVLRELTLYDVELRGGHVWEDVAEEIGQYWKLDLLRLYCLAVNTTPQKNIHILRWLETIARNFMLRIPYDDLNMVNAEAAVINMVNTEMAVMAWHKQNYVPHPGFDTIIKSLSRHAKLETGEALGY